MRRWSGAVLLVLVLGVGLGLLVTRPWRDSSATAIVVSKPTTTSTPDSSTTADGSGTARTTSVKIPPYPGSQLEPGSTGPEVSDWQKRMKERGWPIEVDGRYGQQASKVCAEFQRQQGLRATGRVDKATWEAAWTAPTPDEIPDSLAEPGT
jgi:peptidoglycan hydrolase-like protein with peptidoglycan-binding domain